MQRIGFRCHQETAIGHEFENAVEGGDGVAPDLSACLFKTLQSALER